MTDQELLELAQEASANAYAPYSNFHVGAAALLRDGRVVTGVNVENAAYPLGVCAERCVLSTAAASGVRPGDVEAVAITASPCGGCRQWLAEFQGGSRDLPARGRGAHAAAGRAPARLVRAVRSGFVAVAGRPNVGKSTLVNALAGGKVAIVSDKPQTTRRRISAVVDGELDAGPYQLVLVDLPGFQRPRDALTERMQRTVDEALVDVDGFLFVLAADEAIGAGDRFIAERVYAAGPPVVVAVNKVDRVDPARIAAQIVTAAAPRRLPRPASGQRPHPRRPRAAAGRPCRPPPGRAALLRGGAAHRPPPRGPDRRDRARKGASS